MHVAHLVWICATPRVGQNALLDALRGAIPGAAEYGQARPDETGLLVYSTHIARPEDTGDRHSLIHIGREDRVAQAISWAVAARTGRYHSWQPGRSDVDLAYSGAAVEARLMEIDEQAAAWESYLAGREVLRLTYERDIRRSPVAAARRVLEWCGLPGEPRDVTLERVDVDTKARWRRAWRAGR